MLPDDFEVAHDVAGFEHNSKEVHGSDTEIFQGVRFEAPHGSIGDYLRAVYDFPELLQPLRKLEFLVLVHAQVKAAALLEILFPHREVASEK